MQVELRQPVLFVIESMQCARGGEKLSVIELYLLSKLFVIEGVPQTILMGACWDLWKVICKRGLFVNGGLVNEGRLYYC